MKEDGWAATARGDKSSPEERAARAERVRALLPEISSIQNESLADAVVELWVELWGRSAWTDLTEVPKNTNLPRERTLIAHVRAVTQEAQAVGEAIASNHQIDLDIDLLLAGALLHDVCKLVESEPTDTGSRYTPVGRYVQHGISAAAVALEKGLPLPLVHLIITHTPSSGVPPRSLEGMILRSVDLLDSEVLNDFVRGSSGSPA